MGPTSQGLRKEIDPSSVQIILPKLSLAPILLAFQRPLRHGFINWPWHAMISHELNLPDGYIIECFHLYPFLPFCFLSLKNLFKILIAYFLMVFMHLDYLIMYASQSRYPTWAIIKM